MSNNNEKITLVICDLTKEQIEENYITKSQLYFSKTNVKATIENLNNKVLSTADIQKLSIKSVTYFDYYADLLGKKLNNRYNINLSNQFWGIFLNSWLISLIQICLIKEKKILDIIEKYKNKNITLLISNDKNWKFFDSYDFFHNAILSSSFNEWLNSRIILQNIPLNWKIKFFKNHEIENKYSHNSSVYNKINEEIVNVLSPRCSSIYGFSLLDRIFFSLVLHFKPRIYKSDKFKIKKNEILWGFNFVEDILNKIEFEYFDRLNKVVIKNNSGKLRLISADDITFNSNKIFKTALSVERGEYLLGTQHGGHAYGSALITDFLDTVEINKCFQFLTWGWTNINSPQTVRLPSPYLSKFRNKYKRKNDKIILASTKMNLFMLRIESAPQPKQWLDFRKRKIELIESIRSKENLIEDLYYKPYFNEKNSLKDISVLKNKFHNLKIINGNLRYHITNCKLLILDHPGTTLNIAMTLNTPILCTWDKNFFSFNKQANEELENLEKHKIYFNNVNDLVIHLDKINNDILQWWNSSEIQKIRIEWVNKFALTSNNWRKDWFKYIWNIK